MSIERMMKRHGIERIVFVPASELVPYDCFHAWPRGAWLTEHCGRGETIEKAILATVPQMEAA